MPSVIPIATGILIDKHRLMEGELSQTIEVKKTVSLEDVRGELERIRRREAEVVDFEGKWGQVKGLFISIVSLIK